MIKIVPGNEESSYLMIMNSDFIYYDLMQNHKITEK